MSVDPQGRLLLVAALGAGMAHDLRNVLAAAESSLYLAGKLGDDPAARAQHVEAARRHVRTAQGLVDRALAPARGAAVDAEPLEVTTLCEMASRAWRIGDATTIAIAVDPGLSVAGDVLLLERAIVNLVENADGAAAGRALQVTVAARADDACVRIEVTDDGPGIAEDVRARLFEPLATARPGGLGLGLPLVRAIAEAHGGRVEIESDASGTRAVLVLPAAGPRPGAPQDAGSERPTP